MSGAFAIKTLGDWKQKIAVPLRDVLNVSREIMGRTGEEACRHAIILMAQSARAAAIIAPKKRPVESNATFRHLLKKEKPGGTYKGVRMSGKQMAPYYKFFALRLTQDGQRALLGNKKEDIAYIGKNRGLAKRSWMWGLAALGSRNEGKPIAGTFALFNVNEPSVQGYVKENKLGYIQKAMPAGWEADVDTKVGNKIMANAARKMESEFNSKQWTSGHQAEVYASQFFLPVSA